MTRETLWFSGPREVSVAEEEVGPPGNEEVLVESIVSAVSAGTELLLYRNEVPSDLPLDETLTAYQSGFKYPVKYGYATVGRVIQCGPQVNPSWQGRRVFAFQCHESRFIASTESLVAVPDAVEEEDAVFLANMETAVTLVLDGHPLVGERVAVLGQGIVGLLTTAILSRFPLAELVAFDPYPRRREAALLLGADTAGSGEEGADEEEATDFDLSFELAGSAAALQRAIDRAAFSGRIVVGSWYGSRPATVHLGGSFHRKRLEIFSSQVSTIAPALAGRWSKQRRLAAAWRFIQDIRPSGLVSHRFPLRDAPIAFEQLDRRPQDLLQVVFTYAAP